MKSRIRCFLLERTDSFRPTLRRFTFGTAARGKDCPARRNWGHEASADLDYLIAAPDEELEGTILDIARSDGRWPTVCAACGYRFEEDDQWQANSHRLYRNCDRRLVRLHEAGPGAMWFVPWYDQIFTPQLEHVLCVRLPGGTDWVVDSQANNCTMPEDRAQEEHHCWVISGSLPDITVGKGGRTCSAGAGSIAAPGYHGFLRNGYLEEC